MGHVGLTPQSVHATAERVIADARALEEAGAYAIVLEAIPPDLAQEITAAVSVPTIGIGAGAGCDGQVLVCYDLLGMFREIQPKFAKRFAEVGDLIVEATRSYVDEVQSRAFPGLEHSFKPNGPRQRPEAPPPPPPSAPEFPPADEIPPHWQTH
jgi:3-methyl-2-oxobutanoate hydroxymethyltransferase